MLLRLLFTRCSLIEIVLLLEAQVLTNHRNNLLYYYILLYIYNEVMVLAALLLYNNIALTVLMGALVTLDFGQLASSIPSTST